MSLCSPFPGPLSVLVMDNAKVHHGAGILELAERFRRFLSSHIVLTSTDWQLPEIRIEFLPPYSPDLNPIEEAFSKIKSFLRRHQILLTTNNDGMIFELMEVMKIVTDNDAIGYFVHAGYF